MMAKARILGRNSQLLSTGFVANKSNVPVLLSPAINSLSNFD